MGPALVYLIISLVTYRVTRFVIKDTWPPVAWPRDKILNWLVPDTELEPGTPHLGAFGRSLHYLLTCPWCMSMWIGAAVVWAMTAFVSVPLPVAAWLVASAATGLIASNLDPD